MKELFEFSDHLWMMVDIESKYKKECIYPKRKGEKIIHQFFQTSFIYYIVSMDILLSLS